MCLPHTHTYVSPHTCVPHPLVSHTERDDSFAARMKTTKASHLPVFLFLPIFELWIPSVKIKFPNTHICRPTDTCVFPTHICLPYTCVSHLLVSHTKRAESLAAQMKTTIASHLPVLLLLLPRPPRFIYVYEPGRWDDGTAGC